jgi:DNA ligase-1
MNILSILNEIAANPSKNAKIAILQRESNNELLKQVFKAAYDPTINYYIKKIPNYSETDENVYELNYAFRSLHMLSSRKVTGEDAKIELANALSLLNEDDAEVLARIIQRDLKCGCSESSANKVWKNLIPEFPYMRCSLPKHVKLESWDWKNGIYSQLKADSLYCNMDVIGGEVILTSRAGKEFPIEKFQDIVSEASDIGIDCRIHGELQVAFNGEILPREIGNGILNKVTQGGDFEDGYYPVYSVWDIIKIESAVPGGKDNTPYSNRFNALCDLFQTTAHIKLIETKIVYSLDEAYEHYFSMLEKGLEGTVIKTASGLWKDSTSKDQIKLKAECLVELRIKGFTQGNGKNADTFGSIECESEDGLLEVNVGTGLKDDDRNRLNKIKDSLIDGIVTVKFNGIMKSKKANKKHSLFLPVYIEIRGDKDVADNYQQILDQFDSIIKGK